MSTIPPLAEQPAYISYLGSDVTYSFSTNKTVAARNPIRFTDVWANADMAGIPAVPPTPVVGGGTPVANAQGYLNSPLTLVSGSDPYTYQCTLYPITIVIPGSYSNGAYAAILKDAAGTIIPYNPAVWVIDGDTGYVQFKYKTPAQLGYNVSGATPLTVTYWKFTGETAAGGGGGPITSAVNVGGGLNLIQNPPGVPTLNIATLTPGPGVTITPSGVGNLAYTIAAADATGFGATVGTSVLTLLGFATTPGAYSMQLTIAATNATNGTDTFMQSSVFKVKNVAGALTVGLATTTADADPSFVIAPAGDADASAIVTLTSAGATFIVQVTGTTVAAAPQTLNWKAILRSLSRTPFV